MRWLCLIAVLGTLVGCGTSATQSRYEALAKTICNEIDNMGRHRALPAELSHLQAMLRAHPQLRHVHTCGQ